MLLFLFSILHGVAHTEFSLKNTTTFCGFGLATSVLRSNSARPARSPQPGAPRLRGEPPAAQVSLDDEGARRLKHLLDLLRVDGARVVILAVVRAVPVGAAPLRHPRLQHDALTNRVRFVNKRLETTWDRTRTTVRIKGWFHDGRGLALVTPAKRSLLRTEEKLPVWVEQTDGSLFNSP